MRIIVVNGNDAYRMVNDTGSNIVALLFPVWLTLLPDTLGPDKPWPHGVLINSHFPITPVSCAHLAVM